MTVKKIFLSFVGEKRWLEKMNEEGYELMSAAPFTYTLEKTDERVTYEYVYLKKGKKSFDELDYKSRDRDARAVYANAETALFKKPVSKGEITIFSGDSERRLNLLKRRSAVYTESICLFAAVMLLCMLWSRTSAIVTLLFAALSGALAIKSLLQALVIDKYMKKGNK